MRLIKDSLYRPLKSFPVLADMLTDLSRGNGSAFADMKMEAKTSICSPSSDDNDSELCPPYAETMLETLVFIGCTVGEDLSGLTKTGFL